MRSSSVTLAALLALIPAAAGQGRAEYAGGTSSQFSAGAAGRIDLTDDQYFAFYSRKQQVRIAYDRIDLIEYGQQVSRRIAMAVVISPLFMLSKSRKHFLSLGYMGEAGKQQALVFRVDKNAIRTILVSLEARTGLKVEYQDEEARKAGK